MSKYIPTKLTQLSANEAAAVDVINKNLDSIKEHIDDSVSRSAKSPSQMQADLDMNGKKIINIGAPTSDTDLVRKIDVVESAAEIKRMADAVQAVGTQVVEAAAAAGSAAVEAVDSAAAAEAWATKMDGPVDDDKYSSRYYAENIGADVHTVAEIATDVTTVAGKKNEVTTVAGIAGDVSTVAGVASSVSAVEDIASDVSTVAANVSDVSAVAGVAEDVSTVASNNSNVTTVATNMSDVNDCADNMAAIQDAPNQAQAAADSAALAQQYGNDKINQTHITNCITNIPQGIKLELNGTTLTLKAGSKVYVPNGFEEDGTTPKFSSVDIESDTTRVFSSGTGKYFIFYTNSTLSWYNTTISGTTPPSTGAIYNTSLNKIQGYNSGSLNTDLMSFPLCIVTLSSGSVTSIDQVFNGFGYIGSTIFVLPGVKGLVPNGRNPDGTLKNTAFTVPSVLVRTFTQTEIKTNIALRQHDVGYHTFVYNEVDNLNDVQNYANVGSMTLTSGAISNFNPKTAFHAVDYNDAAILNGNNTFTGDNIFTKTVQHKSTYSSSTTPGSTQYDTGFACFDTDGVRVAYLEAEYSSNGNILASLGSHRVIGGVDKWGVLRIGIDTSGNGVVNASDDIKHEIMHWGIPNYTAGASRSLNTEYTATGNGILYVYGYRGNGSTSDFKVTINNVEIVNAAMNDYNIYSNCFLIKKGDKYKTNNPSGTYELTFFPLIGG